MGSRPDILIDRLHYQTCKNGASVQNTGTGNPHYHWKSCIMLLRKHSIGSLQTQAMKQH